MEPVQLAVVPAVAAEAAGEPAAQQLVAVAAGQPHAAHAAAVAAQQRAAHAAAVGGGKIQRFGRRESADRFV